ncbi:CPn0927/CPn0928 family alpha/beta hydrolase fold protein [Candidatus Chlamydia sanziniae]|uniref:CHLPS 43 kDa protein n=1 Tax=Candidatus Chlamydia sanziniae TaxID=1806891 RepID=A0A1A9HTP1_9CHLA|nr:CPn0927/CPn0928 family alpha/beta hydrolase fold protein [Candidatus Chlamydia sanziniae]ANH78359.1 CHLPS 43 kDa protein [Candidatus Chlamydia sanziniae]
MTQVVATEARAVFFDACPKPSLKMFSSKKMQTNWEKKQANPRLYHLLDIIWVIIKLVLAVIFFIPLGIFWVLQKICQNIVLPAAGGVLFESFCKASTSMQERYLNTLLSAHYLIPPQRVILQCDDLKIDALEIRFPNARPDRWMLFSSGNSDCTEHRIILKRHQGSIECIAAQAQANILLFNYPGVMFSQGKVTRENLVKAYRSCVRYLRDEPSGPHARELIAYGYSLGACVQAKALSYEVTNGSDGVRWLIVKDRAPQSLAKTARQWLGNFGFRITKCVGWEIDVTKHSRDLHCPELFIYGRDAEGALIGDGLFSKETCFAAPFLDPEREMLPGKKIPIAEENIAHHMMLSDLTIAHVVTIILNYFETSNNFET